MTPQEGEPKAMTDWLGGTYAKLRVSRGLTIGARESRRILQREELAVGVNGLYHHSAYSNFLSKKDIFARSFSLLLRVASQNIQIVFEIIDSIEDVCYNDFYESIYLFIL